jgi:hypothetical protein
MLRPILIASMVAVIASLISLGQAADVTPLALASLPIGLR